MSDEDPEVVADIRLRAATMRERGRTGPVQWQPPKIVDRVPCRGRCGKLADWPEDAQERFDLFNRELARRGEAPLDKTRIVFCDDCRAIGQTAAAERNRKSVDASAVLIRELKAGCNPERERELLDKLRRAGHPDVDGLSNWLSEQRNKQNKPGRGSV